VLVRRVKERLAKLSQAAAPSPPNPSSAAAAKTDDRRIWRPAIASALFDDLDVKLENTSHEAAGLAPRKGL
jgi:hypothetical protein